MSNTTLGVLLFMLTAFQLIGLGTKIVGAKGDAVQIVAAIIAYGLYIWIMFTAGLRLFVG